MSTKSFLRSFAGGEITPELHARFDLTKNQTGLARCLNFQVAPHGPIFNRAGWEYTLQVKDSSKKTALLPFIYSTEQAYVLEFGDQYFRVHTEGGTVLNVAQSITSISKANPGVVGKVAHGYTNGQWLFLTVPTGMTELNGRYVKVAGAAADTFQLTDLDGVNINTTSYSNFTAGSMASVIEFATPYLEADLLDLHFTQSADVLTITHNSYQQRQLSRTSATVWAIAVLTLAPTQVAPTAVVVSPSGVGPVTYSYKITAIGTDGVEESLASAAGFNAACADMTAGGQRNLVQWTNAAGAVRYHVYRDVSGLFGFVGQSADGTVGLYDQNIAPDMTQTPPEGVDPFVSAGDYPAAVGYFKGRRWFAGTNNQPQSVWGTRAGTESNMTYSVPTRDDDRIAVRLTARQANKIRHIVPLSSLLLLTSGAEWQIKTQNSDAITPSTIDYTARGYIGASNVQPIVAGEALLYGQARGGRIREMKISETNISNDYSTTDISIMAPHLFDNYSIVSMAYTHAPYKTVWCVRSDGVMLGLTYVPEHQVAAWHQHNTDGLYESVTSVPEGNEDVLYAVIKRERNGATVRNVERLHTRQFTRLQDAFFVDSGVTFDNAIAATLTPGAGATVVGTTGVIFTAGSAVFVLTDVERYIHYDYTETDDEGQTVYRRASAVITGYTDTTHVTATIEAAWPSLTAIASAGWRMTVTTISGLWHLVGRTVAVLADGAVFPQGVVASDGTITLEQPAGKGHIGLPYNADAKTLPLAIEAQAFGQGTKKNVSKVALRVSDSSGVFVGPTFAKLKEAKQRTDEPYGTPPDPITGIMRVVTTPSWDEDGQLCIRQSNPLPLTIVGLVPDVAYGG